MKYVFSDGGRAGSGYTAFVGDCACRALAIAAQMPYAEAYDLINAYAKKEKPRNGARRSSARNGVHKATFDRLLADMGWKWFPTMKVGQGVTVHMREDELPSGRIIVRLSRHYAAVIDGVLHDNHDSSRAGTRAVYGYWKKSLQDDNQ